MTLDSIKCSIAQIKNEKGLKVIFMLFAACCRKQLLANALKRFSIKLGRSSAFDEMIATPN